MAAFLISSNEFNQNIPLNAKLTTDSLCKKTKKKVKHVIFSRQYLVFNRSNGKDISKISKSELIQTIVTGIIVLVTGIFKLLNRRFIIFMAVKNCLRSLKYIIGFGIRWQEKFSPASNCGS